MVCLQDFVQNILSKENIYVYSPPHNIVDKILLQVSALELVFLIEYSNLAFESRGTSFFFLY